MANATIDQPTRPCDNGQPNMPRSLLSRAWSLPLASPSPSAVQPMMRVTDLPPLSDTVARAALLVNDPDAGLNDFAALLRSDPAVTALLLKRANSAAVGAKTTDVRQAVMVLGLKACYQLAASLGMRDLLRLAPAPVAARCEAVLRHSLLVANLATKLNGTMKLGFRGEEFVGGLLHDIGRVVLAMSRPDVIERADPLDFDEGTDRTTREQAILGTDHCAAGAEFATKSKLPPDVTRAILKHHQPYEETGDHRRLVALVSVADHLASYIQRTHRIADYEPWTGFGYGVLAENWSAEQHDLFQESVPQLVVDTLREIRRGLKELSS